MTPIIGVMGSSSDAFEDLAEAVAIEVARVDAHLLTGGGSGVMASVAKFYKQIKPTGLVIGILPCVAEGAGEPPVGYPNQWVDIAIQTHLYLSGAQGTSPLSRNHINILSSTAIVALPGGTGTVSEVCLAYRYRRPVMVFHREGESLSGVPEQVRQTYKIAVVAAFLNHHAARSNSAISTPFNRNGP
ncbi:MAG: molybdenum cofactor carrier protein [Deltaproteobacteria bacterium]|nr:molybdenum cofactor carrier protein [Deltaproteobacteria bacterium]